MRAIFLLSSFICTIICSAQPPRVSLYSIDNIVLPESMNKQVCISGMKYLNSKLYFASERCPVIFEFDADTRQITNNINIQVPQNFEMEGLTSYKNKLYLISENIAAIYEVNIANGDIRIVETSNPLPAKTKSGDGMEGIAANEKDHKFYLLRERNEDMSKSQIFTYSIEPSSEDNSISLKYESMIELPLLNPQWRYSDICYDQENNRLLCLKSYSKGKLRQQYLETVLVDESGKLMAETLQNIPVENFSSISNEYKDKSYSMNLEGITVDKDGNIFIISDNTSGRAECDLPAKEKTILLELKRK